MKIGDRVQYKKRDKTITGEVIDIFPDGNLEVMSGSTFKMLDPKDVIKTLPPKRRIKYIPFFEKGGKIELAQNKWRQVYREYLDGDLNHGTTGKKVTDKDMAMAIAYSEARKIHPLYNVYANGGSITTNFDEICLYPQPKKQGTIDFGESVYDFNIQRGKKKYYGTIELPENERGVVNIIWDSTEDSPKPKDWSDLEVAVTNRTYQYADNKFGLGGFIVGTLLGGYLGFKSGRMMKQNKDPFETERKIGKQTKKVAKATGKGAKKVAQKISEMRSKKKTLAVKKEGGSIDMFPPSGDKELTILSYGGGQDSTALFYKYVYDADFRKKYAPGHFAVVMANTGNEFPQTIQHLKEVKKVAKKHEIPFFFLEDYEYTSESWKGGILDKMRRNQSIIMINNKSCTVSLKILPIYKWMDEYVCKTFPELNAKKPCSNTHGKKALQMFAKKYGKIKVILGIAKGEETRVAKTNEADPPWMRKSIEKIYPMIDIGMDRKGAQDYIASQGHTIPPPSNCMVCPYQSNEELLFVALKYPSMFEQWVKMEKTKIDRYSKELGVQDPNNLEIGSGVKYIVEGKTIEGVVKGVIKDDGKVNYEVFRVKSFRKPTTKKEPDTIIFDEAKKTGLLYDKDTKAIDLVIPLAEQLQIYVSKNETRSKVKTKVVSRIKSLNSLDLINSNEVVRVLDPANLGVLADTNTLPEKIELAKTKLAKDYKNADGTWNVDKLEKYRFSHGHCGMKNKYLLGGTVNFDKMKDSDKLFFRVLNKYKSYTNISIKPGKKGKYFVDMVVHGFEDNGDFTIKDTNSFVLSKNERDPLIKKIRNQNIL